MQQYHICSVNRGCFTACPGKVGLLGSPNSFASEHACSTIQSWGLQLQALGHQSPKSEQHEPKRVGPAAAPAGLRLPSARAPAPSSALNGCKQKAELLFVHTADEAELTAAPDGALTLVLRNVSRFTTYFTGARPAWIQAWPQGCEPKTRVKTGLAGQHLDRLLLCIHRQAGAAGGVRVHRAVLLRQGLLRRQEHQQLMAGQA